MEVSLSKSCTVNKDYMIVSPIDGDAYIDEDYIKSGTWTSNIVIAEPEQDRCMSASINAGDACEVFSSEVSGEGILIQKTIAYDGGPSASPYKQTILTVIGAAK